MNLPFISLKDFEDEAWCWVHDATGVGMTAVTDRIYQPGTEPPPTRRKRRHRAEEIGEPADFDHDILDRVWDAQDTFKLSPPPKPFKKPTFDNNQAKVAKKLFAGGDCLAGQRDLWNPDGQSNGDQR